MLGQPIILFSSSPLCLCYQGDAGETGEPGLQGEVGPPVSSPILHFRTVRQLGKQII